MGNFNEGGPGENQTSVVIEGDRVFTGEGSGDTQHQTLRVVAEQARP